MRLNEYVEIKEKERMAPRYNQETRQYEETAHEADKAAAEYRSQLERSQLERRHMGTACAPCPPPNPTTLAEIVDRLQHRANELRGRLADVATQIVGAVPERNEKLRTEPGCLIVALQEIVSTLSDACGELDRIQSRL